MVWVNARGSVRVFWLPWETLSVSRLARSGASNIFSYFVSFGYTGERLIPGLRRKDWILQALFLAVTSLWPHKVGSTQISQARSASSRYFMFLRQERAREGELDLFPLQKIASSDVILVRNICVLVACVVASCQSMLKQTNLPFWVGSQLWLIPPFVLLKNRWSPQNFPPPPGDK